MGFLFRKRKTLSKVKNVLICPQIITLLACCIFNDMFLWYVCCVSK